MNLLDIAKGYLTDAVTDRVAGLIGGDRTSTTSAFGAAIPSILGGLIGKSSTQAGAEDLHRTLGNHNGGFLDNLGGALDGDGFNNLATGGSGILSGLLGNKLGGVVDLVSKASGLGNKGSSSLMGLITSIIMGVIGKKVAGGLGVSGLMSLLGGQKRHVASALPGGMGSALGLGDLSGWASAPEYIEGAVNAPSVSSSVSATAPAASASVSTGSTSVSTPKASGGGGLPKWLLPLALLGLIGLLAWMFLFKGDVKSPDVDVPSVGSLELPEGFKAMDFSGVIADPGKAAGTFNGFMGDSLSGLQGITSVDTAKAAIPSLAGLTKNIGGFSGIFDKLPAQVQGVVKESATGYLPQLEQESTRIGGIEGIGDILEGPLGGLMGAVKGFL